MHDRFDWLDKVATKVILAKEDIGAAGTDRPLRVPRIRAECIYAGTRTESSWLVARMWAGVEKEVKLLVRSHFRKARTTEVAA